jgi:polyhydroxybutyrate depolymerase
MKKSVKMLLIISASIVGLLLLVILIVAAAYLIDNKTNGTLVSAGEKRSYLLYVPDSYDPDIPTALVVSIHGFSDWPAHHARTTHWNDLADEKGFIVVYPSGTRLPKRWRTTGFTDENPGPDVQFISDLIDKMEETYNIDPARIYVNGFSNGGGMTYLMACRMADRIAAIGSVAGAYTLSPESCTPSRPVPLIVFHGTADPIVPFGGGPSHSFDLAFPVITEWVASWASRNECALSTPIPLEGEVGGVAYSQCKNNADVVYYQIEGGGHAWPGGLPNPAWIVGYTSQQIDASRLMWQFFQDHPLE